VRASERPDFDYVAVGHVTVDVLHDADGTLRRQAGGSALYSGLQAARLGLRTLVLTAGDPSELDELLAPFAAEIELEVMPRQRTTTLQTTGIASSRSQRLLAWAGRMPATSIPASATVMHFAPVAHETPSRWQGEAELVGLTPQGLVRRWDRTNGKIALVPLDPADLPQRCDAIAISETERESCDALLALEGPLIAITAGGGPTEVRFAHDAWASVPSLPTPCVHDDLGAGDVFAAAFFIALHEGQTPPQAAAFGNAAAAVRLGGHGPAAIGDRAEIERRLTG
jgi:sugar/nucleoside kinase (ribokinase family)